MRGQGSCICFWGNCSGSHCKIFVTKLESGVSYLIISVLGSCVDGSKLRYLYSPLAVSNSLLRAAHR